MLQAQAMREDVHRLQADEKPRRDGAKELERRHELPLLVEHEQPPICTHCDESGLVRPTRTALPRKPDEGERLMETALVRKTYAGWCGGTEAKGQTLAFSYPIRKPNTIRDRSTSADHTYITVISATDY